MQQNHRNRLYSIVVPTRERHDVLKHALRTVLRQTRRNFEVVVMDNCSSSETKAVVDSFESPHIRYVRSPERLAMVDNWELGLSHSRGDYISVLGDDDGLMPDAVEIAAHLHEEWPDHIVTWKPMMWFWPNCIREFDRSFCYAHFSSRVEIRSTREVLKRVFASEAFYSELPTLYFSFVPRAIVDSVRSKRGRYFGAISPDIHSGLVDALASPEYIYSFRPLSVAGISKHSTGTSSIYGNLDSASFELYKQEHGSKWDDSLDPRLVGGFIPEVKIADNYIKFKQKEFPDDPDIEFNIPAFLRFLCRLASRYDELHSEVERVIHEMAIRNNLDSSQYRAHPPASAKERHVFQYAITRESELVQLRHYTNDIYVRTIDDFVATIGQMCVSKSELRICDVRLGAVASVRRRSMAQRGVSMARRIIRSAIRRIHA